MGDNPFCDCLEIEAMLMLAFESVPLCSELSEQLEDLIISYCPCCGRSMQEVHEVDDL